MMEFVHVYCIIEHVTLDRIHIEMKIVSLEQRRHVIEMIETCVYNK